MSSTNPEVREALARLQDLWGKTRRDWELVIDHTLTEPVCPTAIIRPEGTDMLRYAAVGNTIEEAILRAAERVYREVILGENLGHGFVMTNPDDHKSYPWLPKGPARFNAPDMEE